MPADSQGTWEPRDEPDSRQRRIAAKIAAQVRRAFSGNTTELLRILNFRSPRFDRNALIELHRRDGRLPDEMATEWAIWRAVEAMRDLARAIVAAKADKTSAALREIFAECVGQLLESGPTILAEYPVNLWTPEQNRRIHEATRFLAPRLLVALWEARSEMLRRLRVCRYPECGRPWFVDPSHKRPRVYCRAAHRVRTSERTAPIKRAILTHLTCRPQRWASREGLEALVAQADRPYFAIALWELTSERRVKVRDIRAQLKEVLPGEVALRDKIQQYRLAYPL